ncbi:MULTISPECIES: sensor histidine kinase [Helcococcus]|uniref:Histidine kinase n=1 Tax=Helcococcus bovis TaxID=3153252 RepID=A0ABW9F7U2_9FIRM
MRDSKITFKKYNRKLAYKYSIIPIMVIIILIMILFISLVRFNERKINKSSNNTISNIINKDYSEIVKFSKSFKDEKYKDGVNNVNKANILYNFYNFKNSLKLDVNLIVFDELYNSVFTSKNYDENIVNYKNINIWQNEKIDKNISLITSFNSKKIQQFVNIKQKINNKNYVIIIDIDLNSISRILNSNTNSINFIIGEFNQVISSNTDYIIGEVYKFKGEFISNNLVKIENNKFYYTESTIGNLGVRVATMTKITPIMNFGWILIFSLFALSIITFFTVVITWDILSKKNMNALKIMISNIRRNNLNQEKQLDSEYFEEFKYLDEDYNNMLNKIHDLIAKNQQYSYLNDVDQVKFLNTQFNPHFLFNALESLRYLLYFDTKLADKYILDLSKILRYTIDYKGFFATVNEEVDYLKSYLEIQKIRYQDRLKYDIEIEENVLNREIPKLILQPIVENSIKYTYKIQQNLEINVFIRNLEDNVELIINDNGPGISEEQLSELLKNMDNYNSKNSIGLYNINKKLKLIYDDRYKFDIKNYNFGLEIRIVIPKE